MRTGCATEQEPRLRPVRVRASTKNVRYSVPNAPKSSAARSMARSLVGHQSCAHSHHVNKPIQSATNPAETDSMEIMESVSEDDVETCSEKPKILPRNPTTRPAIHHPALPCVRLPTSIAPKLLVVVTFCEYVQLDQTYNHRVACHGTTMCQTAN